MQIGSRILTFSNLKAIALQRLKEENLTSYVRAIISKPENSMMHSTTDETGSKIYISMEKSKNYFKSEYKNTPQNIKPVFMNEYMNIMLLFYLYHEIEHIKQYKGYIDDKDQNNISKLENYSRGLNYFNKEYYKENACRFYSEYRADIKASMRLLEDLNTIYKDAFKKETIQKFNYEVVRSLVYGYSDNNMDLGLIYTPINSLDDISKQLKIDKEENDYYLDMRGIIKYEDNNIQNDISDFIYGRRVSIEVLYKLFEICTNKVKTTNLFDTLSEVYVDINENKLIRSR